MIESLLYGLFTFLLTGMGASMIFIERGDPQRFLSIALGFAGGVMVSASFFSLLLPAIEILGQGEVISGFKISFGFILGVLLLRGLDYLVPHLHPGLPPTEKEGLDLPLQKSILLFLAVTIHNIPEGLAVGVGKSFELALAIGLQNIPEGLALALAFRVAGLSKGLSFSYGFFSALVEPIFSFLGATTVAITNTLLPYAMSLAAGAMIFVTIEEIIPTAQRINSPDQTSFGFALGFLTMLILDTGLS